MLATITNVAASVTADTSTISFYNISNPLVPAQIGSAVSGLNALGIAIDASSNAYYLAGMGTVNSAATFYSCAAPAAAASYACSPAPATGAATIPGGQWLAVDGKGNAYATQISGSASGVVRFPVSGPTSTNVTQVYTSTAMPGAYYGLAVAADGSTLYVSEGSIGATFGMGVTVHACSITVPCAAGGTDITQMLITASGAMTYLSGALATGPNATLYVGAGNINGNGSAITLNAPVALVCSTGTTYTCKTGSQTFTSVEGDLTPYDGTAGIAADATGNAYVGAQLNSYGDTTSPTPAPAFMAYQSPGTAAALTPFACTTLTSHMEPACPVNLLPAPPILGNPGPNVATPYALAVTLP